MTDYHKSSNASHIQNSGGTAWGWYGYFYVYFGGQKAGLSVAAGGANR
jgi:hypothetical protein